MKKSYIIYKVQNKINGKLYIGKTYNFEKRKREHILDKNINIPFHKALKKYGLENFDWQIIDQAETDQEIKEKEIYWIKTLNTCIHSPNSNGYNVTLGGEGGTSWNSRPVIQYNLNGEFVNEYISIAHAMTITNVNDSDIRACANGKVNRAGKFIWRFKTKNYPKKIKPYVPKESCRKKRIMQLDLDGNVLNVFESVTTASKALSIRRCGISSCLIGKVKRCNGFQWIYEKDYDCNKDYKYKGMLIGNGIYQLDDNMNIINHFNNCTEAARALNEPDKVHKQIFKALSSTKRCRGFRWMKVDEYNHRYANTELT